MLGWSFLEKLREACPTTSRIGEILAKGIARKVLKENNSVLSSEADSQKFEDPILNFISLNRSVTQRKLCEEFKFSQSTAYRKLKRFVEKELIGSSVSDRQKTYFIK